MSSATGNDRTLLGVSISLLVGVLLAVFDAWAAAGIATWFSTGTWSPPLLSPEAIVRRATTEGVAGLAPGAAPAAFWVPFCVLAVLELAACGVVFTWAYLQWGAYKQPSRLAHRRDLGDLAGKQADAKARELRPSLQGRDELGRDRGIRLMRVDGKDAWMSWEDFALIIMGPRSNKTSAVVVPSILSANGPVVATSNKGDIWSLTASLRAKLGTVWTFDPQHVAHVPQRWYWDPLRGIRATPADERVAEAMRFAAHFMATLAGGHSDPFFHEAAARVLSGTILAAAWSENATMREVVAWLRGERRDAIEALDAHGAHEDAADLEDTLNGADVTMKGIFETARTAISCLRSEALMRWITPPHTWARPPENPDLITEFDPWQLLDPTIKPQTVYLLSKEGGGSAAPVITALVDRIGQIGELGAQARGGRLDPSLLLVLDESANVCPLKNLPNFASHWGSRGLQAITILQSYKQGTRVWEAAGMDALWSASTVKLVGAGVDDHEFLGGLSTLIGEHYVKQPISVSKDRSGGASESFSLAKEPIFPVSRLRSLPKTDAIMLNPGKPVAHGKLLPWYREEDFDGIKAVDITRANQQAGAEIRAAAVDYLGPDNPLARVLANEAASRP